MTHETVETNATVMNNLTNMLDAQIRGRAAGAYTVVAFKVKVRLVENMVKSHDGSVKVAKVIIQ